VIHLEGMGVVGSILSWNLLRAGVDFTWHDSEAPYSAWQACTGAVYPSGHAEDMQGLAVWRRWNREPPWPIAGVTTEGAYWFSAKHPPHQGKYPVVADIGYLRLSGLPSVHLDAQRLVQGTRSQLAGRRRDACPPGSRRVIAHGFGPRLHHVVWGWMTVAQLQVPEEVRRLSQGRQPCFYLRQGRFGLAYAYPVPGQERWYVGSDLITQREAHPLGVEAKYGRWCLRAAALSEGLLSVLSRGPFVQGWRPAPSKGDDPLVRVLEDGSMAVKPLWHCGVRHAPSVVDAVLAKL